MKAGDEISCTVEKLAYGGKGLCRVEGLAVFVERGLPGQKIMARLTKVKKRFAEAAIIKEYTPNPHPAETFCPHFPDCGGCDWQDLDYAEQLRWKRTFVAESLSHVGGLAEVPVLDALPSPATRKFRNKMEFAFAGGGRKLALGLRLREGARVFDTVACGLMDGPVNDILGEVRAFCRESNIASYDARSQRGFWRHLVLRRNTRGEFMAHLITAPWKKHAADVERLAERLTAKFPEIVSFVHGLRKDRGQFAISEKTITLHGPAQLEEELLGRRFRLSANAFFQVNTQAAAVLYETARNFAALTGKEEVFDLYSGVGSIALCIADRARHVTGFEVVADAVRDADANAELNGVGHCRFIAGDLKDTLADDTLPHPDVIITDPPRAGMDPDVVSRILDLAPERIIYVSCNPTTLARDAGLLAASYTLEKVRPVDLFPHTHHIESVALFVKK